MKQVLKKIVVLLTPRIARIVVLFFGLLSIACISKAQGLDSIFKKDGKIVIGKVLTVTSNSIEFDPAGEIPFIFIDRSEITGLKYSDGTVINFESEGTSERIQDKSDAASKSLQIDFFDSNNIKISDIQLFNGTLYCNQFYKENSGGQIFSDVIYAIENGDIKEYKIGISINWTAITNVGKLFSKKGAEIFIQSISCILIIKKEEEIVFTRDFLIPNFSFEIARAFIQGNERTISNTSVIDYTSDQNHFSYGGVNFNPIITFYDGIYIWEPNTRIGEAYESYKVSVRVVLR